MRRRCFNRAPADLAEGLDDVARRLQSLAAPVPRGPAPLRRGRHRFDRERRRLPPRSRRYPFGDLARLYARDSSRFQESIAAASAAKQITVTAYKTCKQRRTVSRRHRLCISRRWRTRRGVSKLYAPVCPVQDKTFSAHRSDEFFLGYQPPLSRHLFTASPPRLPSPVLCSEPTAARRRTLPVVARSKASASCLPAPVRGDGAKARRSRPL